MNAGVSQIGAGAAQRAGAARMVPHRHEVKRSQGCEQRLSGPLSLRERARVRAFGRRNALALTPCPSARERGDRGPARNGIVLLVVLVVIAMLTLVAVGFSDLMLTERKAAQTAGRQVRARVLAQSGAELARQFLDRDPADQTDAGGLYDNPQRFEGVLIADDAAPQDRGRCWVVAPRLDDGGTTIAGVRYGLQDESTRINLATILTIGKPEDAKTMLMALPGMTDEIADAILDWIDADDTPRPSGAESDFYGSLSPPYAARNGPPVTIEELLLVRGVTPELLFGLDAAAPGPEHREFRRRAGPGRRR